MKKYLIIADTTVENNSSIQRGIELAKLSGAAVHIVGFAFDSFVSELIDPETIAECQQAIIHDRQNHINETLKKIDHQNITLTSVVVWEKNISDWAVLQTKTGLYNMIIKTGHRSEKFYYTPSDWQLFRESPVPVMIVVNEKWRQKDNILCALDLGSKKDSHHQLNREIIKQGKVLAELLQSELYCCYAIPISTVLVDLGIMDYKKIEKEGMKKAQLHFAKLANEFGMEASALLTKTGDAEKVISSIANKLKTRMVVVGTHRRMGIKGKVLGNTAEKVLHHLHTDILAVGPGNSSD